MSENPLVRPDKTKWHKTRQCACGDCRFYSERERPKCPAMEADPKLIGEWLWSIDPDMLGCKDYVDPMDFAPPSAFTEKAAVAEADSESPPESSKK